MIQISTIIVRESSHIRTRSLMPSQILQSTIRLSAFAGKDFLGHSRLWRARHDGSRDNRFTSSWVRRLTAMPDKGKVADGEVVEDCRVLLAVTFLNDVFEPNRQCGGRRQSGGGVRSGTKTKSTRGEGNDRTGL